MKRILTALFLLTLLCAPCPARQHKVRVSCIGDSITWGMTLSDREREAYPSQLQSLLGEGYEVRNFGKNGATLLFNGHRPYIGQEEFRSAMQYPADVLVIHLGVNDTDPRDWPNYRDEFVGDYLTLIDTLRTVSPGARVMVALLTPITPAHHRFSSGTKTWHDEIQDAIRVVAELSGAELVDFHTPLYPYPEHIPDAVHPDALGASLLARTVFAQITGRYGGLRLPAPYSDGMVLQRGVPLDIHGWADAGQMVTVSLGGDRVTVRTGRDGKWKAVLPPRKEETGLTLTVSAPGRKVVLRDVAVGEVWLLSGQSNMEFTMRQAKDSGPDIAGAEDPDLRFLDMKARWRTDDVAWPAQVLDSVDRLEYFREAKWEGATPASVAEFSAVGYYFARTLRDSLRVPVGVICNAVGGSTTESWVDRHTLETKFPIILGNWLRNDFIQDWARGRARRNLSNRTDDTGRHPYQPCYLFEAGILPLGHYAIKGVAWYQGESNAHNKDAHSLLFTLLVDSWRRYFSNPALPFYYVQLSSLGRPSWPWFRDSQRLLSKERTALGMVVTSDLGDPVDVHYREKKPVGRRLALWALRMEYGYGGIVPSGPLLREAVAEGDEVILSFDYGEGLHAGELPAGEPLDGDSSHPVGFEVASREGCFHPASARTVGDKVVLTCPQVKSPTLVRYAWKPYTRANLYNGANLPASTFRAEVRTSTGK